ncbi:hypothetical protein MSG28_015215 [Choristoneura fumiferana]|uniref:Uncharacterized protein n=1 Tax=Choristoneura fumiferana TaxID=7141 RepID=A0ACC0KZS5_CHOFU|nr:hypothetical protein MSG28_015215 [Choristoneura fumiferana]
MHSISPFRKVIAPELSAVRRCGRHTLRCAPDCFPPVFLQSALEGWGNSNQHSPRRRIENKTSNRTDGKRYTFNISQFPSNSSSESFTLDRVVVVMLWSIDSCATAAVATRRQVARCLAEWEQSFILECVTDLMRFHNRGSKYLHPVDSTTEPPVFIEDTNLNGYFSDASNNVVRRAGGPKEPAATYMAPVNTDARRNSNPRVPMDLDDTDPKHKKHTHKKKKSKRGHKKHHKDEKKRFNKISSIEIDRNVVSLEDSGVNNASHMKLTTAIHVRTVQPIRHHAQDAVGTGTNSAHQGCTSFTHRSVKAIYSSLREHPRVPDALQNRGSLISILNKQ